MNNRIEFLRFMQGVARTARSYSRELRKGIIIQQIEKAGFGPLDEVSGQTHPLVAFPLAAVQYPEDYFGLRIAEEEAWRYFHKKYVSEWIAMPAGLVGSVPDVSVPDDHRGYGHGV